MTNELPPTVRAPWTDDQLESLYGFQRDGRWHEFTCPRCGSTLIPRTNGWICWRDDYTQDWAHEFMTNWRWKAVSRVMANVDYCSTCDHPVNYHGNNGCSMLVQQGTSLPIMREVTSGVACGCKEEWSADA